jgi:polar amino acid transport system permease protein
MATRVEPWRPSGRTLIGLAILILVAACLAVLVYFGARNPYWRIVVNRFPYILTGNAQWWPIAGGFVANVYISAACMAIGTLVGVFVGIAQVARFRPLRWVAWLLTHFFRNSPWLVVLYAMLYLLPFRFELFGIDLIFPSIAKAIIGLSLPAAANVSEIVRGGILSIETGQWEAAFSLGYTRWGVMWHVILPQAVRRMIPPWMNLYAIVAMGTALTNLVGVSEGLTAVRRTLEVVGGEYAIPFYLILLALFIAYCYPIARFSRKLESRFN